MHSNSSLAQNRIAHVLDMHENNMKILHKGKVLFPHKDNNNSSKSSLSLSPQDISQRLIEISMQDSQENNEGATSSSTSTSSSSSSKKKKPSLVVMGTRKTDMERDRQTDKERAEQLRQRHGNNTYKYTWSGRLGYYTYSGSGMVLGMLKAVIGGVFLLFKSILPGGHITAADDDERR